MSKDEILIRYSQYLKEVEKDIFILEENLNQLKKFFPLNEEKIQYLASKGDTLKILDQLAYRFLKMQETLGKLLKFFLLKEGEIVDNLTMLDIVHKTESLGIPINDEFWFEIRSLRNSIAHEYPELYNEVAEAINSLYEYIPKIKEIVNKIKEI
ncbi:MAG: hypothetical protein DSY59_03345 [Persephonella sp.]|nr:MAG: hypothetical protein DSY59_03345 [Persephonella sp.]